MIDAKNFPSALIYITIIQFVVVDVIMLGVGCICCCKTMKKLKKGINCSGKCSNFVFGCATMTLLIFGRFALKELKGTVKFVSDTQCSDAIMNDSLTSIGGDIDEQFFDNILSIIFTGIEIFIDIIRLVRLFKKMKRKKYDSAPTESRI